MGNGFMQCTRTIIGLALGYNTAISTKYNAVLEYNVPVRTPFLVKLQPYAWF